MHTKIVSENYWITELKNLRQVRKEWLKGGQNDNIVIENDNSVITPLQKTITENNKVKESKVKESKEKESKENNIDRKSKKAETAKRFAPPSVKEVQSYISEKEYSVRFCEIFMIIIQ